MNIKQLEHFVALAEHHSFIRASEACGITQPAFSRSIRNLEETLGCQLVDRRSGRNFRPTSQGERVLQHALTVLQGISSLTNEINQTARLEMGEVNIGAGPMPALQLVPHAIAQFLNRHPRMQVHFEVANWRTLDKGMKSKQLDFVVAASPPFLNDPAYEVTLLTPQRMALFCRRGHPLLEKPAPLKGEDIFAYPMAMAGASRDQVSRVARSLGANGVRLGMESDNIHALLTVIANSDAVGLLHADSYRGTTGDIARLDNLPRALDAVVARYGIIVRRDHRLSPGAERMLQTIKELDNNALRDRTFLPAN
ncbi:LysR family transcriptional regulator [Pseudomonas typographi]|uniref:LysR family transcriptional regulator n=1 Tax=Pseudomonas typographi TaxID=2715964 RepID=A0ABR7Z2J7_9PSED|nr:LysR family transcriptional regulator [Pseudomonas typographi]MBD1552348.1 LysR family transcriptional regulator [Pseudomonas typographi]MBD1587257.1 LysR family transcriptional regulator [Pseudomonas typographi]MBD1599574.1 LysR family transcriptional regulator [Pseudomonas typographi]